MKRLILLVAISLIFTFKLQAKKIEGQILFEHDTINVVMKVPIKFFKKEPNFEALQNRVVYFDSQGNKKILEAGAAKEFRFKHKQKTIRMLSRKNTFSFHRESRSYLFLKLELDGKLKVFNFYHQTEKLPAKSISSSGNGPDIYVGSITLSTNQYIYQKGNGQLREIDPKSFEEDMVKYFSDCPELSKKIKDKEVEYKDLGAITRFYNSNCE